MYSEQFENIWSIYPRKIGKLAAWKEFNKALKNGATYDEIGRGVIAYGEYITENRTEQRFICHLRTWLHNCRWHDNLTEERANNRRQSDTGISMVAAIEVVSQNQPSGSMERVWDINGDEDLFYLPPAR